MRLGVLLIQKGVPRPQKPRWQVDFADLDGNLLIANDRFDGMKIVEGKVTLADKPGIGVTPIKKG